MDLIEQACEDADDPRRCRTEVAESLKNLKDRDLNFLIFNDRFVFSASETEKEKEKWGLSPGE